MRWIASNPVAVWAAFVLAHLYVAGLNLYGDGYPLGDVTSMYPFWVDQALVAHYWVGIDGPWVYPIVAIVPMLAVQLTYPVLSSIPLFAPLAVGSGLYAGTWLVMILLLDLIAFGVLTGWGSRPDRFVAAWWWTAFLVALGPIAMGRIDSVTVPLAVVGALLLVTRPRLATVILTVAAWIKVWPGALVLAMTVVSRQRWRILLVAAGTSAGIVALALSFGSGANVLSFVTAQTGRSLQVEAPITTFWMWRAFAGDGTTIYYDQDINTWQVTGAGVSTASSLMTPLMLLVVGVVVLLGVLTARRGASPLAMLPPLSLAILTALIAFQKVGSPQFMSWLAVPVILGLVLHRQGLAPSFGVGAGLVLGLGVLTQLIYPVFYGYVLSLHPLALAVLSARNLLTVIVLAWSIVALVSTARWREPDAVASVTPGSTAQPTTEPATQPTTEPAGSTP